MTSVRYKTTGYLLGTLDTKGEYRPKYLDYQTFLSWRPNKHWSFDALGNISDNNYRFVPEERETKFGTMNDAKNFRVYFDGQEKDFFRTYFAAFSLTRHFNANTFLALQYSAFTTHEQENYDIQGEYWLNESQSNAQLGVGTYMEHARNRLQARVSDVGLRFRTRFTAHTLQLGFDYKREHIRENASQWEMRDSMGHSLPTDPDRLMLIYSERSKNEITTNRLEAYLQDTWRIKSDIGSSTSITVCVFPIGTGTRKHFFRRAFPWGYCPPSTTGGPSVSQQATIIKHPSTRNCATLSFVLAFPPSPFSKTFARSAPSISSSEATTRSV